MKKYWFEIIVVILFIVKLWMVSVQPIYVLDTRHDDGLFTSQAISVVEGKWLGPYNDKTLSKGVVAILFIAMAYKIGISYLTLQQIFYFLACISMVHMLKHVISKKGILLICYVILLLNPISYSDAFSYVYRDGLYAILILFLIAFSFELFFHYKDRLRKVIIYSIALGVTFTSIYFCREETIWLYPYLILATMFTMGFILGDKENKKKKEKILCVIGIPIRYFSYLCSYTSFY